MTGYTQLPCKLNIINKRLMKVFIAILSILPFLVFAIIITKYQSGLVVWDELKDIVPKVMRMYEGNLEFTSDIWSQQNEHRSVFPTLIILFNARYFNWNMSLEIITGIILFAGVYFLLIHQFLCTKRSLNIINIPWPVPIISLFIFSLTQLNIFKMGFGSLQYGLLIFFSMAGIIIILRSRFSWSNFSLSAIFGIISTFSHGSGLAYWPSVFLILFFIPSNNRHKIYPLVSWALITCGVVFIYRLGFHDNPGIKYIWVLNNLFSYTKFILVFIGTPICNFNTTGSLVAGLSGLTIYTSFLWILIRRNKISTNQLVPYIALGAFTILNALLIGTGRAMFGTDLLLAREFKPIATPIWIANIILIYIYLNTRKNGQGLLNNWKFKQKPLTFLALSFSAILLTSFLSSGYKEYINFRQNYESISTVRHILLNKETGKKLELDLNTYKFVSNYPYGGITYEDTHKLISFLRKNGLSIFRNNLSD